MQSGLKSTVPVIGFCAYSGTGKTTLLIKLLPILKSRGVRVGVIKHTHHRFELDRPGKDSYELRKAGAAEMLVASGRRWALMVETGDDGDPVLQDMVNRMDQSVLDLIIVEGFKHEAFPKIELHRPELGRPPIFQKIRVLLPSPATIPPLTIPGFRCWILMIRRQ